MPQWVKRWHDIIADEPELPGVWRRKEGGFHVRGRVRDARTGKLLEVKRRLPDCRRAKDALQLLDAELVKLAAATDVASAPRFADYAVTVFERKIALGRIRSAAGRMKWSSVLSAHLIPHFGGMLTDKIGPSEVKAWQEKIAAAIRRGELAPTTANTTLAVLTQILREAAVDFDMRDPMRGVAPFDTRTHRTYSEEQPNALRPADVAPFLTAIREHHPRHFGFSYLALVTGLRPSSIRPLRRSGPNADLRLDSGVLLIRRSHTIGNTAMDATKTGLDQRLHLPAPLLDVLAWHVSEQLHTPAMRASELLFPSVSGGFRARSCLDKAFVSVSKAIGLPYRFTPRGLRRTYQDLARGAGVADVVTRSISGHQTESMQRRYSTVAPEEMRGALAAVIDFASGRRVG